MSENNPIQLRPGILVNLSTSVRPKHEGAVVVEREPIEVTLLEDGRERKRWRTTRTMADPDEHKSATRARLRVRTLVKGVCADTPFGLVCAKEDAEKLTEAFAAAEVEVAQFNESSQHYRVVYYYLLGEVRGDAATNAASVRAEIGNLLEDLERATRLGEVDTLRDLCGRATQMGKLLEQGSETNDVLGRTVRAYRRIARQIVRRVERAGEDLAEVLTEQGASPFAEARFVFLGEPLSSEAEGAAQEELPSTSPERFAALETGAAGEEEPAAGVQLGRFEGLAGEAAEEDPEQTRRDAEEGNL